MFWIVLGRVVDLTFLLLAVVILTILMGNSSELSATNKFSSELSVFKKQTRDVMDNNIEYVEGRVNRLAETQDSYMITMSRRIDILESKLRMFEEKKKEHSNVVNTNNNVNVINPK